jgi:TetR/AcrR family transcriptional repressor of nem operon
MARYSAKHKGQTRDRILAAADRAIKARGIDGASVDAIMRDADLTVGGFYAHFASKDELARETLLYGLRRSMERLLTPLAPIIDDHAWLCALIHSYLRRSDDSSPAAACPLTVLLPEVARGSPDVQRAFGAETAAFLDRIEVRFPEVAGLSRRDVAAFVFSSCAGAVAMAHAIAAPKARDRLLQATEKMLSEVLGLDR